MSGTAPYHSPATSVYQKCSSSQETRVDHDGQPGASKISPEAASELEAARREIEQQKTAFKAFYVENVKLIEIATRFIADAFSLPDPFLTPIGPPTAVSEALGPTVRLVTASAVAHDSRSMTTVRSKPIDPADPHLVACTDPEAQILSSVHSTLSPALDPTAPAIYPMFELPATPNAQDGASANSELDGSFNSDVVPHADENTPLDVFIACSLYYAGLEDTTVYAALCLLNRLRTRLDGLPLEASAHRLFFTAYMLASKIVDDDSYDNRMWHGISGEKYPVDEINVMEREMCQVLQYRLHVDATVLEEFRERVDNHFADKVPKDERGELLPFHFLEPMLQFEPDSEPSSIEVDEELNLDLSSYFAPVSPGAPDCDGDSSPRGEGSSYSISPTAVATTTTESSPFSNTSTDAEDLGVGGDNKPIYQFVEYQPEDFIDQATAHGEPPFAHCVYQFAVEALEFAFHARWIIVGFTVVHYLGRLSFAAP